MLQFLMKRMLILIVLFFPNFLHSQNLTPLSDYMRDKDYSDKAFSLHLFQRCASFFRSEYDLSENASAEASKRALSMSTDLLDIGASFLSQQENISAEMAEKKLTKTVNEIAELYIEDFKDNLMKTGSYYESGYLKEDNSICVDLFKNFKDYDN